MSLPGMKVTLSVDKENDMDYQKVATCHDIYEIAIEYGGTTYRISPTWGEEGVDGIEVQREDDSHIVQLPLNNCRFPCLLNVRQG